MFFVEWSVVKWAIFRISEKTCVVRGPCRGINNVLTALLPFVRKSGKAATDGYDNRRIQR
jgi:hypothetical protein